MMAAEPSVQPQPPSGLASDHLKPAAVPQAVLRQKAAWWGGVAPADVGAGTQVPGRWREKVAVWMRQPTSMSGL